MTAAFFLGQDVNSAFELLMGLDGTRQRQNHAALDLVLVNTAQQQPDVVAGLPLIKFFAEHLNTRDRGLADLGAKPDDIDILPDLADTAFDTPCRDCAAAGDRENILDGHQERLVEFARRHRDPLVNSRHQINDTLGLAADILRIVQRFKGGAADDRGFFAVKLVFGQQVADLHLNEIEKFRIGLIALIKENNDTRDVDLTRQQDVLLGLGHRAVSGRHDQDRAVHLGRARDHVLDVVSVAGAIDMRVVTRIGLVLKVRDVDRNAALFLFRSVVDRIIGARLGKALFSKDRGDRR